MELNICHLYPDLLNSYGDTGNILTLKYRAEKRGIQVNIINISINNEFIPENYDIVFFCGGQDYEQKIVSQDIIKNKKEQIQKYIQNEGVLIAICGGYQLLGKYYQAVDGTKIEGLDILDIYTIAGEKRFIGNIGIENQQTGEIYVGFENHAGKTYINNNQTLGKCIFGFGNDGETGYEGCVYKNTYCSYLHGTFLSKNPELADKLIYIALSQKYENICLERLDDDFELKAKQILIERYKKPTI